MRDGPLRAGVKWLARVRYSFDLRLTRAVRRMRGESVYELRGECVRSGCCCETPMIQVHPLLFFSKLAKRIFLAWHLHVNGFVFIRAEREGFVFVFRCAHFDSVTRRCDSYATRPGMCRDYPRALLWSSNPEFFDDCGYSCVSRNAASTRAALRRTDLTDQQREELERRLHIRD